MGTMTFPTPLPYMPSPTSYQQMPQSAGGWSAPQAQGWGQPQVSQWGQSPQWSQPQVPQWGQPQAPQWNQPSQPSWGQPQPSQWGQPQWNQPQAPQWGQPQTPQWGQPSADVFSPQPSHSQVSDFSQPPSKPAPHGGEEGGNMDLDALLKQLTAGAPGGPQGPSAHGGAPANIPVPGQTAGSSVWQPDGSVWDMNNSTSNNSLFSFKNLMIGGALAALGVAAYKFLPTIRKAIGF